MSERTCIAVDSACDLPAAFIKEHNLQILPITLKLDGHNFIDNRNHDETIQFHSGEMGKKVLMLKQSPFQL